LTFGPAALALAEANELVRDRRDTLLAAGKTADIATYARCGAEKLASGAPPPKPLYLREADAKPQEGFALPRKAAP